MQQPTARTLILDLLATEVVGGLPVRALVAAAEVFGIADNNIRVTLNRLLQRGSVERNARGQYVLGARTAAIHAQVSSWRQLEDSVTSWTRRGEAWLGIVPVPGTSLRGAARTRRDRALALLGFRALHPGLLVRPDNLSGDVDDIRRELGDLGLEQGASVLRIAALSPADDARARGLWDTAALEQSYRDAQAELARSAHRLDELPLGEAMAETFVLGGRILRQLVMDPRLPEPIVDVDARRALLEAMRQYDRQGRRYWARFMAGFGVRGRTAPADLRVSDAARRIEGAPA